MQKHLKINLKEYKAGEDFFYQFHCNGKRYSDVPLDLNRAKTTEFILNELGIPVSIEEEEEDGPWDSRCTYIRLNGKRIEEMVQETNRKGDVIEEYSRKRVFSHLEEVITTVLGELGYNVELEVEICDSEGVPMF